MSVEDRSWMYEGWNDNGCHSLDWVRNTNAFLDQAFSAVGNSEKDRVVCPCSDCGNKVRRRRAVMSMHLCKREYMPGYTIWTEHGQQPISEPTLEYAYDTADGLDQMLANLGDAMHTESVEDEPTADAKVFYALLSSSKEPLHKYTSVAQLTAVSHLMAIKSQHNLPEECINKLLNLLGDVLPEDHKMPKTLYECQCLLRANHYSCKFKPCKGGSNSIAAIRQKLSKKLGRPISDIEAWVHTHRGSNPEDITSLNTEGAAACLDKYKAKSIEFNGPDFDWLHSPVNARALYE